MSIKLVIALLTTALFGAPIDTVSIMPHSIIGALTTAGAGKMVVRMAGYRPWSTRTSSWRGTSHISSWLGRLLAGPAS
jgi:hypothetical protein